MNERILVIDDEVDIRILLKEYLADEGYVVEVAQDGREGLEKARLFRPHLVVTDIFMPQVDGIEVILALTKSHAGLPIIATSQGGAVCRHRFLEEARQFGAIAILEKPFSLSALLEKISATLAKEGSRAA